MKILGSRRTGGFSFVINCPLNVRIVLKVVFERNDITQNYRYISIRPAVAKNITDSVSINFVDRAVTAVLL